jgi:hypothetical protein
VREFLEKNFVDTEGKETVKLALRALMETVEAGSKNLECAVMEKDTGLRLLKDEEVCSARPPKSPCVFEVVTNLLLAALCLAEGGWTAL